MRALIAFLALGILVAQAQYIDSPALEGEIAAGRLQPVAQRLPENPMREAPGVRFEPGRHGGELRLLFGRAQDLRQVSVYGYARLVMLTPAYDIVPDILERVENEGDRVFTMHLRRGHRWSDGHAFTAEDFRYWWEDVANNRNVSPSGPPRALFIEDQPPEVTIIDEFTVRYAWRQANPYFLMSLTGPAPMQIFRPAHYLRRFHQRYVPAAELAALIRANNARNWAQMHNRLDAWNRNDNPDMPTLDPWMLVTRPPADRFILARNPYFHRVDPAGRQLPYVDRVVVNISDGRLIPARTGAGESDLQARNIAFANYTFLRQAARRNDFDVRLWRMSKGAHVALYPNLNVADPVWRALNRDVRFRRALSLATNRREVNQVIYFGLALEGQNTVLPGSPLYRPEYRQAYAQFNLREANRLLDEIGLTRRDSRGIRLLPDGRPLEVIVETSGEDNEQVDVLELVHDSWLQAGIKLYTRPSQRELFRNRVFSGQSMMTVWAGLENGLPTPAMSPEELSPSMQVQLQWPRWGQFVETNGQSGEAIDDPAARELQRLAHEWRGAPNQAARELIWHRILQIHAEQVYTIGLVADVRQPVVVSNRLHNVPREGIFNWEPGAFFGVYRPDLFWFGEPQQRTSLR